MFFYLLCLLTKPFGSNQTLVLERLDSLLSLTHQRNPSSSNSLQTSHNNGLPLNRPSPTPAPTAATALALHLPPTPPSTSPPGYTALPESIRTKENSIPRAKPKLAKGAPKKANHNANVGADIQPPPRGVSPKPIGTLDAYASSDATPATSPVPSLIRDAERRTNESRPYLAKRSTASDFASEPDEEVMTFGTAGTAEDNNGQDEMDATMPASNNALRLSDIPSRRAKRKFSDEEPDEEVLEFGRPAQEIKRAKTASQSPASIAAHTPAAMSDYTAPSPHSRPAPYQSVPLRSSAAAYGSKMVHGSSPLAAAMVLSSSSDDDDSDDDEFEEVMTSNVVPAPGGDPDGEEDDFLAAAFNDDDDTLGLQDGAASDHSGTFSKLASAFDIHASLDDSSDESDYDER